MIGTGRIPVLVLIAAVAAGCAAEGETQQETQPPAAESAPPDASALNDAQIAHVAVSANTIDVETARLAESRAEAEDVKAFARTMITDHTAVNEQAAALAQRLGVTPEENAVSSSLLADGATARAELESLRGGAFDRAYIEREVGYHEAVLNALDQTLIPGARHGELRGLLEQVRPAIVAHLEHARSVRASLSGEQ